MLATNMLGKWVGISFCNIQTHFGVYPVPWQDDYCVDKAITLWSWQGIESVELYLHTSYTTWYSGQMQVKLFTLLDYVILQLLYLFRY